LEITGNTVLITGGASGIGFALAQAFLKEGNEVIICGRRTHKLQEAKRKLPHLHWIEASQVNKRKSTEESARKKSRQR
jgi:short-subunit dehydrogenase involved in D-alanine esterification of teichoic acids